MTPPLAHDDDKERMWFRSLEDIYDNVGMKADYFFVRLSIPESCVPLHIPTLRPTMDKVLVASAFVIDFSSSFAAGSLVRRKDACLNSLKLSGSLGEALPSTNEMSVSWRGCC
jgi:hypothetical protein